MSKVIQQENEYVFFKLDLNISPVSCVFPIKSEAVYDDLFLSFSLHNS